MERKFKNDVSESLKRLYFVLLKKAESRAAAQKLSQDQSQKCMEYLNFLQFVASNTGACCNPEYFVKNVQRLGFDVQTDFNLFDIDESVAQCVYDIMLCRRDYIFWGDEKLLKTGKFGAYKYKSRQEAIDAMRSLKQDSMQFVGGRIPYLIQRLRDSFFAKGK